MTIITAFVFCASMQRQVSRRYKAIVKPLRKRSCLEADTLKRTTYPRQHLTDVKSVRNDLRVKDHCSIGADNADASHLQRNIQAAYAEALQTVFQFQGRSSAIFLIG